MVMHNYANDYVMGSIVFLGLIAILVMGYITLFAKPKAGKTVKPGTDPLGDDATKVAAAIAAGVIMPGSPMNPHNH